MGRHNKEQSFRRDPEELSMYSMEDYAWDIIRTGCDFGYEPTRPHYEWDSPLGSFSLVATKFNTADAQYFLRAQDSRLINVHHFYSISKHTDHIIQLDECNQVIEVDDESAQDHLVMDYLRSNPLVPEHTLNHSGLINFRELAARTAILSALEDGVIDLPLLAYYSEPHQPQLLEHRAVNKLLQQGIEVDGVVHPYSASEDDIRSTLKRFINQSKNSPQRSLPPPTDSQHEGN